MPFPKPLPKLNEGDLVFMRQDAPLTMDHVRVLRVSRVTKTLAILSPRKKEGDHE